MKKMEEEFIEYCKNSREEFVTKFNGLYPEIKERVIAEDFLICFDQLFDKYQKLERSKTMPLISMSAVLKKSEDKYDVDSWVNQWRALFPDVKSGGYSIQGTKGGCAKKLKQFFNNNPEVTKEEVFQATKLYIEEFRRKRWAYMKIADYFVSKDGGSLLEQYIDKYK